MGFTESIKTLNATVRTVILAVLVGVVGYACYFAYAEYTRHERMMQDKDNQLVALQGELETKDATINQLGLDLQAKKVEIDRLETSMTLLKTDQRLASLRVVSIDRDADGQVAKAKLEFVELSPQGEPLSEPRKIELPGDIVYVDNWIVKFNDEFIEQADIERGTSLCLFRRIFSENQSPTDGVSLDEVGMRPQAYSRGGKMSEFEQQLWSQFWEFANDEEKANEMGIRAAHGEAVSIKVKEGKAYQIELRASGGLTISPVSQPALQDPAQAL